MLVNLRNDGQPLENRRVEGKIKGFGKMIDNAGRVKKVVLLKERCGEVSKWTYYPSQCKLKHHDHAMRTELRIGDFITARVRPTGYLLPLVINQRGKGTTYSETINPKIATQEGD